jgi:hypothetical protein
MSKQTAVQWLIKQVQNRQNGVIKDLPVLSLDQIFDQAKAMERGQNANTWNNAINAVEKDKWESFEQYYNQTYGGTND